MSAYINGILLALFIAISLLAMSACSTNQAAPLTNQIEAASKTVHDVAVQIDRLQKTHVISNAREDELMSQLLEVNAGLRLAATLAAACSEDCSNAEAQLKAAQALLTQLETKVNAEKSK